MSSLQALRVSVHNNPEAEAERSYAPWGVEQALSLSCKSARNARLTPSGVWVCLMVIVDEKLLNHKKYDI